MQQMIGSNIKPLDKHQSDVFWCLKGFAVFTIFFAHMPAHPINGSNLLPEIFDVVGMVGVPLFLLIAGFFDYASKTPLQKRIKKTLVPLLIWGGVTFVIHIMKTPSEASFQNWVKWIYGCGSWYYFVPVLLWCQIFVRLGKEWIWLLLGFVSSILSICHLIPYNEWFTPYVNPLNFIVFFCVGRLIRKVGLLEVLKKSRWLWIAVSVVILSAFLVLAKPFYWAPWTLIFTFAFFVLFYLLFEKNTPCWLVKIGMMSYVIYLCHMQMAGFVHFQLQRLWGTPYEFVKVPLAFALVCLFCYLMWRMMSKMRWSKALEWLGFR